MQGIRNSKYFVVLATSNFADGLRDDKDKDHLRLLDEIAIAKSLSKPFVIIWDEKLSSDNEQTIRSSCKGCFIYFEIKIPLTDLGLARAISELMIKERLDNRPA